MGFGSFAMTQPPSLGLKAALEESRFRHLRWVSLSPAINVVRLRLPYRYLKLVVNSVSSSEKAWQCVGERSGMHALEPNKSTSRFGEHLASSGQPRLKVPSETLLATPFSNPFPGCPEAMPSPSNIKKPCLSYESHLSGRTWWRYVLFGGRHTADSK